MWIPAGSAAAATPAPRRRSASPRGAAARAALAAAFRCWWHLFSPTMLFSTALEMTRDFGASEARRIPRSPQWMACNCGGQPVNGRQRAHAAPTLRWHTRPTATSAVPRSPRRIRARPICLRSTMAWCQLRAGRLALALASLLVLTHAASDRLVSCAGSQRRRDRSRACRAVEPRAAVAGCQQAPLAVQPPTCAQLGLRPLSAALRTRSDMGCRVDARLAQQGPGPARSPPTASRWVGCRWVGWQP